MVVMVVMAAGHAEVSSLISKRYVHLLAIYFLAFTLTANLIKIEISYVETTLSAPAKFLPEYETAAEALLKMSCTVLNEWHKFL